MDFTLDELKKLRAILDEKIADREKEALTQHPINPPWAIPYLPYPIQFTIPQTIPIQPLEPENHCAIQNYFKEHPNETSVSMVCTCRFCTPYCNNDNTITAITLGGPGENISGVGHLVVLSCFSPLYTSH